MEGFDKISADGWHQGARNGLTRRCSISCSASALFSDYRFGDRRPGRHEATQTACLRERGILKGEGKYYVSPRPYGPRDVRLHSSMMPSRRAAEAPRSHPSRRSLDAGSMALRAT